MLLPRLRYDERLDGWQGVLRAMAREATILSNCAAGRLTMGPTLNVDFFSCALVVAGRVIIFLEHAIRICSVDSGAVLAELHAPDNFATSETANALLDRWIPYADRTGRGMVLDCLSASLAELAPPGVIRPGSITICGAHLLYQIRDEPTLVLVRATAGAGNTTILHEVAHVRLHHTDVFASLYDNGESCLLYDSVDKSLQMVHIDSGVVTRRFAPRKCGYSGFASALTHATTTRTCVHSVWLLDGSCTFLPGHRFCSRFDRSCNAGTRRS